MRDGLMLAFEIGEIGFLIGGGGGVDDLEYSGKGEV